MKALLVTPCCCEQEERPNRCSDHWAQCPEYLMIDLPGLVTSDTVEVCVPWTEIQYWNLFSTPGFPQEQFGNSTYAAGDTLTFGRSMTSATQILLKKKIFYDAEGQISAVIYEKVPDDEQIGVMSASIESTIAGQFTGVQNGGPIPRVTDRTNGASELPLRGAGPGYVAGVEHAMLSAYAVQESPEDPVRCRVELDIRVRSLLYGGVGIEVNAKWPSNFLYIDICDDTNKSYVIYEDFGAFIEYRAIWSPVDLSKFIACPGGLGPPAEATYFDTSLGPIPANDSIVTEWEDCDPMDLCNIGAGCGRKSWSCKGRTVRTGRGFAIISAASAP